MKKIELLAPAGDMECLKAAISAGCDAVYLSMKLFGARAFAKNFSKEELIDAINYSHLYAVKVYLAVNTVIYEKEVDEFINYVRFAHQNNIDAVIIQDLGMLDLVRKKFPNLEIHASTQMHIHNFEGALFAKKMGIKRVVIARETPIEVIRKIKKEIDIEVEVFGHGALCVSYSGQCFMSSLIGKRSGNRGTCAQCCRKTYDFYDEENKKISKDKYLLSTKDLCVINYLDKIIDANIDSIKIEGRMKRKEYVYIVVSIYRKAIDGYYRDHKLKISDEDIINLKKIFNREFTKGFIFNEENKKIVNQLRPNHQGIEIGYVIKYENGYLKIKINNTLKVKDGIRIIFKDDPGITINEMYVNKKRTNIALKNDIVSIKFNKFVSPNSIVLLTTDSNQIKNASDLINKNQRKVLIDISIKVKKDSKVFLKVSDDLNEVLIESNFIAKAAINEPISSDTIIKQISKTGNTIYKVRNIDIELDENVFLNIKDINDLRRKALLMLDKKRLYKVPFIENDYYIDVPNFSKSEEKSILVNNKKDYIDNFKKYDNVYVTDNALSNKYNCILKIPRVVNKYEEYDKKVLIGEVGSLIKYKTFDTDFSFNVVNSYTVAFLHSLGAKRVTLSYNLTVNQIKNIVDKYHEHFKKHPNLEVINEGIREAMICKFDINKMYGIKIGYLKDEYNNMFKTVSSLEYMTIYDYKKIKSENKIKYYEIGVNSIRTNLF